MNARATYSRETEYLHALIVLNATGDGDDLEPADLRLLEEVVNFGTGSMGSRARQRWDALVTECQGGLYGAPRGLQSESRPRA